MTTSQIAIDVMKTVNISLLEPPNALTNHARITLAASVQTMATQKKIFSKSSEKVLFVAMTPTPKKTKSTTMAKMNTAVHACFMRVNAL